MWWKFTLFCAWSLLQSVSSVHSFQPSNESNHKSLATPYLLTEIDSKIIGGSPVAITKVPWQVSIRLKSYEIAGFGRGHLCGGSVLTSRVIISAAHCTVNSNITPTTYRSASEFTIVMGSVYLYEVTAYTLQYDVLEVAPNLDFSKSTLQNDVALFFIDGSIPENHATVKPIPLNQLALSTGVNCTVTGWGITESGIVWAELLGAVVPIVASSHCNASYKGSIDEGMICAGYPETGGIDACQGDSGGPLACNGTLGGIVSWGNGCAERGYPGVYANVSHYYNWIVSTNSTFNYTRYGGAMGLNLAPQQLLWGIFCVLISLLWS
ncbi:PREDICTED: trypsin-like [Rhagoletis zephyria]|uniref:trypsin-like n=1 Tax=Rhagoletis zephyria TaxID=28612 RepID=UPI0008115759|nr:PREDICTED: trypsin-like [Rhagoletis zephyria]